MAEVILKNIKKSYPHMSVCENISFPLKLPKTDKAEINQRVNQAAKILCITEYLERKPKALSGGQRQCGTSARQCLRPGHPYDHTATAIESSAAVAFGSTISFTVSGSTTHVSDRESGKNLGK